MQMIYITITYHDTLHSLVCLMGLNILLNEVSNELIVQCFEILR